MARRISCSMTIDGVRDRTKVVTRRHVDTWLSLLCGDRLTIVEKAMGLPKGSRQVVLGDVEVVDVRVEPLGCVLDEPDATVREGLAHLSAVEFVAFWLDSHGYRADADPMSVWCRRIEWVYLDD